MLGRGGSEIGDLRADIREWRRGRATATLADVLQDVYVGVSAVLMLGAMVANVVVGFRREADDLCVAAGCVAARAVLPWLTITATLAALVALARLLGPLFTSPAAGAWLLSTPVDRAALLRRRLVLVSAVATLAGALVALPTTALAGLAPSAVAAATAAVGVAGAGVVAVAAAGQVRETHGSRWLLWALLAVTWTGLLVLAVDRTPGGDVRWPATALSVGLLVVLLAGVLPVAQAAWRRLAMLRRRQLEPGGNLSSGLSGALATLDLALAHDVVVAHTARARGTVRPRRGGPRGPLALVWRDLVRLRRRPASLVWVAGVVVAPYAVAQAGGGRLTVLVATLVGFVAAVPLCLALRVLVRTPALVRMLPHTDAVARGATLVVPLLVLACFGVACAPALASATGAGAGAALALGLAAGVGAVTSTAWWMAARPVDYGAPAVSTPMGAVPPGMVAGALRGPDMVLLTSAPALLAPTATGAAVSLLVSLAVLAYVLGRR